MEHARRWAQASLACAALSSGANGPVVAQLGGPKPRFPFVAAIDCAAVPRDATGLPFPSDGHLLLFALPEIGCGFGEVGEAWHVSAGTPVAEWADPENEPLDQHDLRLTAALSPPNWTDWDTDHPYAGELGRVWADTCGDVTGGGPIQVGGHPLEENIEPVNAAADDAPQQLDAPFPDDWVLLADWHADVPSLDLGIAHWVISRSDLAALRFDRVHVSVDMVG